MPLFIIYTVQKHEFSTSKIIIAMGIISLVIGVQVNNGSEGRE